MDVKRYVASTLGVVAIACVASAQESRTLAEGPAAVHMASKIPLERGLVIEWVWAFVAAGPEGRSSGRLGTFEVQETPPDVEADEAAGLWIPAACARSLAEGVAGRTTVRIPWPDPHGDTGGESEFRLAGRGLFPCTCNGHFAVVPVWVLIASEGSLMVNADPGNPLVLRTSVPYRGPSTWMAPAYWLRAVTSLTAPNLELRPIQ